MLSPRRRTMGDGSGDFWSLPAAVLDPFSPYAGLTVGQVSDITGMTPAQASAAVDNNLAAMIAANDQRTASLQNVDPWTALQSKISGTFGQGAMLPLALAGLGLAVLVLSPSGSGRR